MKSGWLFYSLSKRKIQKKKNMCKTSGDEGCHSKNAVPRHGVFAVTGPRMLVFVYTSFHAFVVTYLTCTIEITL
jgi:hypothetical protein